VIARYFCEPGRTFFFDQIGLAGPVSRPETDLFDFRSLVPTLPPIQPLAV